MIVFNNAPGIITQFKDEISAWLIQCIHRHGVAIRSASYSFLSIEAMVDANKKFLQHNYLTDIITFNYSEGKKVRAEILVSSDFIEDYAHEQGKRVVDETDRVLIHGLLHCVGFDDTTQEQQEIMRNEEDNCLLLRPKKLKFRSVE